MKSKIFLLFFFFNDTATTEIYTLSLHDALPSWRRYRAHASWRRRPRRTGCRRSTASSSSTGAPDRKSTRLNSSHVEISYAVFCLKKKKQAVGQELSVRRREQRRGRHVRVRTPPR